MSADNHAGIAHGLNGHAADKPGTLIDCASVYTPLYGVVLRNERHAMPKIIERDVISGPGATLWGANAVNGLIDLITKRSAIIDEKLSLRAVENFDSAPSGDNPIAKHSGFGPVPGIKMSAPNALVKLKWRS